MDNWLIEPCKYNLDILSWNGEALDLISQTERTQLASVDGEFCAIITGKGPEKEEYEKKIRALNLKRVAFRTMWLSAEDYPLLLGTCLIYSCLKRLDSSG